MSGPEESHDATEVRLAALIDGRDILALVGEVRELHPSDIADVIERLEEADQIQLLSALPTQVASEALAEMEGGPDRGHLLAAMAPERSAALLEDLADDDAADLMGELQPVEQEAILEVLPDETADDLRDLLKYEEDTAGGLMTTEVVAVDLALSADQALGEVRRQGQGVEEFYTVFVVGPDRRLVGTLRLDDLVIAEPTSSIEALVTDAVATVEPHEDQEEVGRLIARYNLAAIPVVSRAGVLLGRITFDDVIDVIEAEQTEDILRLAGVTDEEELRHSWTESVRTRLPWLLLNLVTAALAAGVILYYEEVVAEVVTLAFLAPIIAALGGSSGTQSLAITIRRLTIEGSGSARGFVLKELLVGLVIGAILGVGIAGIAYLIPGAPPRLGLVVMLAMWGNQVVAGVAGAFVPATLDRLGVDPSVASSVFVHTLTDLCGFFLLLGLASRILL